MGNYFPPLLAAQWVLSAIQYGRWPSQAASRYATYDNTGVGAARNAAARGETVYILDQESANAADFLLAGFEIVEVEEGVLYRLEPPEPLQPRADG